MIKKDCFVQVGLYNSKAKKERKINIKMMMLSTITIFIDNVAHKKNLSIQQSRPFNLRLKLDLGLDLSL